MNIKLALNQGTKILKNKFINSSQLDAEILMAKSIKKDRKYILLNLNKTINKTELINFYKLINERSRGNPIAYLINKKSFWNSEFFVTRDTLIPRPDTELIVENAIVSMKKKI
tara:strand:- start:191 stop:529 length:339 start_codon:yes stop_codon:yes gene_type:complete